VIDEKSFDKLAKYIDAAKQSKDIEVIAGGSYDKSKGYFIQPTVLLSKGSILCYNVRRAFRAGTHHICL
jgi:acyl-CoA reductase-like NAD-dependent aldehyde dehydrogenase